MNYGFCNTCKAMVPVSHVEKQGKVYLAKDCPQCGVTETLVSSNAEVWAKKRIADGYDDKKEQGCDLNCLTCQHNQSPMIVFVDVTNRCNQNCPICVANIRSMGFQFEPPMAYFDKIFSHLTALAPRPSIKFFGGEPTVRKDFIDIVKLAHSKGLSTNVVTNGLRLADEDYCRELLATGTKTNISFDGREEAIYGRFRGETGCYALKLKALENIRKYTTRKNTLMCVVAKGINDHLIADLVQFCHENSDFVNALEFLPIVPMWEHGKVDAELTTIEDTEAILHNAIPGVEFVPAGMLNFETFIKYFKSQRTTFGHAHPNCESVTKLVSDGTSFQPLSRYLKRPLLEIFGELRKKDQEMGRRLAAFERSFIGRALARVGLGERVAKARIILTVLSAVHQYGNLEAILGPRPFIKALLILGGVVSGKKLNQVLARHTKLRNTLTMIVLPFEETNGLESERLERCPAAFAYEDPDTRQAATMPVCSWMIYKNEVLRKTTEHYGLSS